MSLDTIVKKAALAASNGECDFLERVILSLPYPFLVLDENFVVKSASSAFYQFFNARKEDTQGRLFHEMYDGRWNIPELRLLLDGLIRNRKTADPYDLKHTFENSAECVVRLKAHYVGEEGYEPLILLSMEDITGHDVYERALKDSEEKFRQLSDSIPQLAWMADADGWVFWYNKRWYDFTGTDLEEMEGWGWQHVIHPDHVKGVIERFSKALTIGLAWEDTFPIRSREGRYRWFLSRAFPAQDSQGKITRWFGTNTDVTDQLEKEQFIHSILDSSPDCIKVLDIDGRLLSMNKAGVEQMEIEDFSIFLHKPWVDFWSQEGSKASDALAAAVQGGMGSFVGFCPTSSGKPKWWEVICKPIKDAEGFTSQILCISRDITERKIFENRLHEAFLAAEEARSHAEAANIAKSEFLANISHEIRTPMNAVLGLSNILQSSKPLTQRQKECIETLHMSAESLLALINDLLDISKIETNSMELEQIPFSLSHLAQNVVDIMDGKVRERGLALTFDDSAIAEKKFIGDPTRVRQIMLNLLSNAVKFTEQGEVKIIFGLKPVTDNMAHVSITIADTGIGIPEDKLETVFQKFTQADNSITRKYGGTGLGLTITRTLTDMMQGTIDIESTVGKGTAFTVTLPLKYASNQEKITMPKENTDSLHARSANSHVLLVEDYEPNVLVATLFLEQFGYTFDVATNGQQALEFLRGKDYAVVLMDVQMQDMNGFEVTQKTREYEMSSGRPRNHIIGMTAHAMAGDRERCLSAGMDDYISKPFDPDQLRDKLEDACREPAA